eukprot:40873_1
MMAEKPLTDHFATFLDSNLMSGDGDHKLKKAVHRFALNDDPITRSTSAPPVSDVPPCDQSSLADLDAESFTYQGEKVRPGDPRLSPAYYAYYYSQRPLDPRLPRPLFDWSSWNFGSSKKSEFVDKYDPKSSRASLFEQWRTRKEKELGVDSPASQSKQTANGLSLYDRIQTDFPRTPSPVYPNGAEPDDLENLEIVAREREQILKRQQVDRGTSPFVSTKRDAPKSGGPSAPSYRSEKVGNDAQVSIMKPFSPPSTIMKPLSPPAGGSSVFNPLPSHTVLNTTDHMSPGNAASLAHMNSQMEQMNLHEKTDHDSPPSSVYQPQVAAGMNYPVGVGAPFANQMMMPPYFWNQQQNGMNQQQNGMNTQQNGMSQQQNGMKPAGQQQQQQQPLAPQSAAPADFGYPQMDPNFPRAPQFWESAEQFEKYARFHAAAAQQFSHSMPSSAANSPYGIGMPYNKTPMLPSYPAGPVDQSPRHQSYMSHMDPLRLPGSAGGLSPMMPPPLMEMPNAAMQMPQNGVGMDPNANAVAGMMPSRQSLLNDLKTAKGSSHSLNILNETHKISDVVNQELVVELATDQNGSRFIQQKLENASPEEKHAVFEQIVPETLRLCTDVFGNYVIQKFFEYGLTEHKRVLAKKLIGNVLPLTLQMYGCRVVQKALEVCDEQMQAQLVVELRGHVLQCVKDQNGNHVIQKCIEKVPAQHIDFVVKDFVSEVRDLSMHPYGCRVIQRLLEHCNEQQKMPILEEIVMNAMELIRDQYGNYVIQHVLQRGALHYRSAIIRHVQGNILSLSKHKFASNVVERCFVHGSVQEKSQLVSEICGTGEDSPLNPMVRDQYANYVVQRVLGAVNDAQRMQIINRLVEMVPNIRKVAYGKHIVARVEKLTGKVL